MHGLRQAKQGKRYEKKIHDKDGFYWGSGSASRRNGCVRKKTEAVITTDGEEFSEPEKEYPTVAQSRAKKFSYNDLTVGKLEYLMTEDEVIKILGEPVTSYNANEKVRQPRRKSSKKKFIRITS